MGRGIAQIAALGGITVLLYDARDGAAEEARGAVASALSRLSSKGRLPEEDAHAAAGRLVTVDVLDDVRPAHIVLEAIVEDLEAKRALFRALEAIVSPGCVLATNTSSLSVTAIAAACARPERVVGFHFFNPVPLMKVVEVIDGVRGDRAIGDAMMGLAKRLGHAPVRAKDTPGFVVNHAGRGFGTEALRLIGEDVATPLEIDAIMRDQAGFRLGPFELFDLVGLDISVPVMESVYRQYFDEPRFRPSVLATQRRAAGLLGRKSGEGYYRYVEGSPVRMKAQALPQDRPSAVWISPADPVLAQRAVDLFTALGTPLESSVCPSAQALCIVTPLGEDVSSCCARELLDARRTVGLDLCFDTSRRRTLMLSPVTDPAFRRAAHGALGSDGAGVSIVRDSVGLVAQRIVATIINIACDMAQQGIATPADIDRAVMLGLGYPMGPLTWGDRLGARTVLKLLDNMMQLSGDPRYRPSPWLRRRAQLSASLHSEEPALSY